MKAIINSGMPTGSEVSLSMLGIGAGRSGANRALISRSKRDAVLVSRPEEGRAGRDDLPVYDDEEPSLGQPELKPKAAAEASRKILYYRNPKGVAGCVAGPEEESNGDGLRPCLRRRR